jgi:hypothetical protein
VRTLPKKTKTVEEHLEVIENLLVGIILKRKPNVKELAKIIGISDNRITEMYPKKGEVETEEIEATETGETSDQQTGDETSA